MVFDFMTGYIIGSTRPRESEIEEEYTIYPLWITILIVILLVLLMIYIMLKINQLPN